MSDKESIIINLDNIDTNTKETEELRWRLQEEAYIKIKELFKEYNGKIPEAPQDISECRTRNTALIVGGRGSGKTYFLLNISKYLKKTDEPKKSDEKIADKFHFFAPIDPTLLHKNENFLTVILAKILNELEKRKCDEKLSDEDKREFYKKLAQVAEAIDGFDGERKSAFQIISSDQSGLRLEQYIHEFFGLVSKTLGNKQLVLLIDDVDMAFEKGYEALETVRKYLASPYVISVVTGDICLYGRIIHKEFADNLSLKQKELDGYMEEGAERICREGKKEFVVKLTDDYLGKLFEHKARAKLKSFKDLSRLCEGHIEKNIELKAGAISISLCDYRKTLEKNANATAVQKIFEEFNLRKFLSFAKETLAETYQCKNKERSVVLQNLLFRQNSIYALEFDMALYHFEKGVRFDKNRNCFHAMLNYKRAIKHNSNYVMAYNNLGVIFIKNDLDERAIDIFYQILLLNSKSSSTDINTYDKSIKAYEKATELNPEFDKAFIKLGIAYINNKEYGKGIHSFERAKKLNLHLEIAYILILQAYIATNEGLKMNYQMALRNGSHIATEKCSKIYNMLLIIEFSIIGTTVANPSNYEEEIKAWEEKFSSVPASWDFTHLDEWSETLEEGRQKVVKSALATFKQHFNNQ